MEPWAIAAMLRWPNVPAVFGWLGLDRRGRWLVRGEPITRPQIIETISRNYAVDEQGRWYFQNGPQRGYVSLAYTPLVLRVADFGDTLVAQTGQAVSTIRRVFLDETGALLLDTDLGPGLLLDTDLAWALDRLRRDGQTLVDADLEAAMALPSGVTTDLRLVLETEQFPVVRLDSFETASRFGFDPAPTPAIAGISKPH